MAAEKFGDAAVGEIRRKGAQCQAQAKSPQFVGRRQTARAQQSGDQMKRRRKARQTKAQIIATRRPHPQFERPPLEYAFFPDPDHVEQAQQFAIGAYDEMLAIVSFARSLPYAPCAAAEFRRGFDQSDGESMSREFDGGGEPRPAASDDDVHVVRVVFCSRLWRAFSWRTVRHASHSLRIGVKLMRRSSTRKPSRSISSRVAW